MAAATKESKIGFIALGDIGLPMASHLLKGGFDLQVYDLRKEAVEKAVALGARAAESVKAMAASCSYICIAVVNEAQMRSVISGPDGLFENARPGTTVIAHSTIPPETAKEFARLAEAKGVEWLDAPMSGASIAAKAGTLNFLVGGKAELLERCRPILNAMGANIFHLGPTGAGAVGKLVNGLLLHVGYVVTLEALKLAAACDVPEEKIIELVRVSTGNNWVIEHWGYFDRLIEEHTQGPEELIQTLLRKDIADALIAAKAAKTTLPMAGLAIQLYPELTSERRARRIAAGKKP